MSTDFVDSRKIYCETTAESLGHKIGEWVLKQEEGGEAWRNVCTNTPCRAPVWILPGPEPEYQRYGGVGLRYECGDPYCVNPDGLSIYVREAQTLEIKLNIPERNGFKPECVEIAMLPFARIRYSLNGKKQKWGLRMDIEKSDYDGNALVLDHFDDDPPLEEALRMAIPKISEAITRLFN